MLSWPQLRGDAQVNEGLHSKKVSEWRHIVSQHNYKKSKFGEYDLHYTDNVILVRVIREYRRLIENSKPPGRGLN